MPNFPWKDKRMSTRLVHVVIDAIDPVRQARFWSAALGWETTPPEPNEVSWTALADPEGSEFCVLTPR